MKKTHFYDIHQSYNAKMVEFAGFIMPIQYPQGIIHEHQVVRSTVGVFDVSHMGEFEVKGKDALSFIQKISINDASKLNFGQAQYSAMAYPHGGLVDDMLVYNLGEEYYMLVVNGANVQKDWDWVVKNKNGFDVELTDKSDDINLLAVQGPKSLDTLQKLTETKLSEIEYYNFKLGKIAGFDAIISRTGYTGELGFEIYFIGNDDVASKMWQSIFDAGKEFGIEPIGLGARDTLRLEKGYCLYGNDIDDTTNPIEASLGWITKLSKGQFNGSDVIAKVKEEKPNRKLVGFISDADKFIPRHHYKILSIKGNEIGHVTSGNISPTLNKPIGMGYVASEFAVPGTEILIESRGKQFKAIVSKTPFL
jgi:aminomethyltransferase